MPANRHPPKSAALLALMREAMRFTTRVSVAGDALLADKSQWYQRLTFARWQVLRAFAESDEPRPIIEIAAELGVTRQTVQRMVEEWTGWKPWIRFAPNPRDKRAKLVVLTDDGRAVYAAALRKEIEWLARLTTGLNEAELRRTTETLKRLMRAR